MLARILGTLAVLSIASSCLAQPLTTAFTFQGQLDNAGTPVTGAYDLKFTLFDSASGGAQVGSQLCSDNVAVTGGRFTVQLDFGAQFAGTQRFLEVSARQDTGQGCAVGTGFVTLSPRQGLTASPNAVYALSAASAASATNATQFNGQPPSFYSSAANLTSGLLPDARLSSNVAFLGGSQTFTGNKTFSGNTTLNGFVGIGTTTPIGQANMVLHQNTASFGGMYIDTNSGGQPFYGYSQSGSIVAYHFVDGLDNNTWKLFTGSTTRLAVTVGGNVGIGTTTPAARLDVNGTIRSNNGFVFPDGSTQYRALASTTPPIVSGLPTGTTFSILLGGTTASLAGAVTINHPATYSGGNYLFTGQHRGAACTVRRVRTADQQWITWVDGNSNVAFAMTLTLPSGGGTVNWSAQTILTALRLVSVNGVLMEEADLFPQTALLNRTSSAAATGSAPTTDVPSVAILLAGNALQRTVVIKDTGGLVAPVDITGVQTGSRQGMSSHIRSHPVSDPALWNAFANSTSPAAQININGSLFRTSPRAILNAYYLRMADDGLPIEEYDMLLSP